MLSAFVYDAIDKQKRTRFDLFIVHWATSTSILSYLCVPVHCALRLGKHFFMHCVCANIFSCVLLIFDCNFSYVFQIHWHSSIDVQWLLEITRCPTKCPVRSTTAQRNHFESIGLHCSTTFAHKIINDCVCETGRHLRQRLIQTGQGQRTVAEIQCNRAE